VVGLPYRPPLDWESLLGYFRTHPVPGVEAVTGGAYERVVWCGDAAGFVRVSHGEREPRLIARLLAGDPGHLSAAARNLRRMFDLDCDPGRLAAGFGSQRFLDSLRERYPGLRVAGGWDPFETAVSAVLGQLVSRTQATGLVRCLVERLGRRIAHSVRGREAAVLFPSAETLAGADLSFLGTTAARRNAIRALSRSVAGGEIDLGCGDVAAVRETLLALPGIGPWSAEYISLRALADRDAFPGTDLILKRATDLHPDLDVDAVRPWRGYAAVYLWRHYAESLSFKKRRVP
jgi:AraC family transcriptional regulator of adaptative response / DNA-3-methyladenine glycosylase II